MRLVHRDIDPPDLTTYESYSEFPQEIESDSDTEVILGPPKHQTKINTPERNWEETPPETEGDTHPPGTNPLRDHLPSTHPPGTNPLRDHSPSTYPPGTNPLRDHSPSANPPGAHSPPIAAKFPHPYHRAHAPHTPDTHPPRSYLLHRPHSPPSPCSPNRPDSPESGTNLPAGNHSPPPYSPDHTHTPAKMSSDEEHPDPMTAFMKKFKDTLEDLGANKHINVPQF